MSRPLGLILLFAVLGATPVEAQIINPDGWVGEGGRIIRRGDAPAGNGAVHPATRADWLGECERRLAMANQQADPGNRYVGACRAWLDYYEQTGATAEGYGFAYAIPVTVTMMEGPGNCPPPPAVKPPPPPRRQPIAPDKRVKTIRY